MAEGTVPVPPHRPCAERDNDVLPVQIIVVHVQKNELSCPGDSVDIYLFGGYRMWGKPQRRG